MYNTQCSEKQLWQTAVLSPGSSLKPPASFQLKKTIYSLFPERSCRLTPLAVLLDATQVRFLQLLFHVQ